MPDPGMVLVRAEMRETVRENEGEKGKKRRKS